MNLPNKLTVSRMILVPFILALLLPLPAFPLWNRVVQSGFGQLLALILFIIASLTDMLDGQIARKRGLVSNFGKFLDPIADKLLVIATFLAFVQRGRVHAIFLLIIIAREFLVTGIRLIAAQKGEVIAASPQGKLKTVSQLLCLIWLLSEPILARRFYANAEPTALLQIGNVFLVLALILTLSSGIEYFKNNIALVTPE